MLLCFYACRHDKIAASHKTLDCPVGDVDITPSVQLSLVELGHQAVLKQLAARQFIIGTIRDQGLLATSRL